MKNNSNKEFKIERSRNGIADAIAEIDRRAASGTLDADRAEAAKQALNGALEAIKLQDRCDNQ